MQKYKRLLLFLLCFAMIAALVPGIVRADPKKDTVKRTIGIVFDNSGSMYLKNNTAWSQAQYAMEVFASMMNDSDTLLIYPMHPITVGKGGSAKYDSDNPLRITDRSQAANIRNIYTSKAAGTPGKATVEKALKGLKKESGEKWLIVLTDGKFEDVDSSGMDKLFSDCLDAVNVMYLGISSSSTTLSAPKPSSSSGNIYSGNVATDSSKVPGMLTDMCNMIFGRDQLKSKYINGQSFTFDIPMSKIYIFIQGTDISNVKLKHNGTVKAPSNSSNPQYGKYGGYATYDNAEHNTYDSSLQGCLMIYEDFDACAKGDYYNIEFSGTKSKIDIYYEPDVDLSVQLYNEEGTLCNKNTYFTIGDYELRYCLVDKYGKQVESELLGQTKYTINYHLNGNAKTSTQNSSGVLPLRLNDGDKISVDKVKVVFLSGYTIEKSGSDFGYLADSFTVHKKAAGTLKMNISGGQSDYDLSTVAKGVEYKVTLTYDGTQLKGADLNNVVFNGKISDGGVSLNTTKTNDGYTLKISGDASKITPGKYTITCDATYTPAKSDASTANGQVSFTASKNAAGSLKMAVSGGQNEYDFSAIEKGDEFKVVLSYNGTQLKDAALNNVDFSAKISGGGVELDTQKVNDGYILKISGDISKIAQGNYRIDCDAKYVTDISEPSFATGQIDFRVSKVSAGNLKINVSGGKSEYDADTLSDEAVYNVTFSYNGSQLTGDALKDLDFTYQLPTDKINVTATPTDDGYTLNLSGDVSKISSGDYRLALNAKYDNGTDEVSYDSGDIFFSVKDVSGHLTIEIDNCKDYYILSELENDKGIKANVRLDGEKLTDEQFSNAVFTAESDLPLTWTPIPGESAYLVKFDTDQEIELGDYSISFKVENVKDRMGNILEASDKKDMSVNKFPKWLKILIYALLAFLILLLLHFIFTFRVLPRTFSVDGAGHCYVNNMDREPYVDCTEDTVGNKPNGQASKWTQYDREYENYRKTQRRMGIASTLIPAIYKQYPSLALSKETADTFSKDLYNSYLEVMNDNVTQYQNNIVEKSLNITNSYLEIEAKKLEQPIKEFKDFKKVVSYLKVYYDKVVEKDKSQKYIISTKISSFFKSVFTNTDIRTISAEEKYAIESLFKMSDNTITHPCAARCYLYKLQDDLELKKQALENDIKNQSKKTEEYWNNPDGMILYGKTKIRSLSEIPSQSIKSKRDTNDATKNGKKLIEEAIEEIKKYGEMISKLAVYDTTIEYIKAYSEEYEDFFKGFEDKVKAFERQKSDIILELKYKKGDSEMNVCSDEPILKYLSEKIVRNYSHDSTMLTPEINGAIFDQVKKNALNRKTKKDAGEDAITENVYKDIFDETLMKYFNDKVKEKAEIIDVNIINAIALEYRVIEEIKCKEKGKEFEYDKHHNDAVAYIKQKLKVGERIAAASIQRMLNDEPREIKRVAYNKSLLEDRKFDIKTLLEGGDSTETVTSREIRFYNALYNITPDKLKKFAAP